VTPATKELEAAGIAFSMHTYDHDPSAASSASQRWGLEAADALGLDRDQVFKTLVVVADGKPAVAIVPVSCQLSLKAAGAALGTKRVEMCDVTLAERTTGYVAGGISPFGQRRRLSTIIDETCELYDEIYVSGGRRGLDIGVAPSDLIALLRATVAAITA
jgi:Cys-tRNA(Pro)/Cys-tRNA(Cys) deacylase